MKNKPINFWKSKPLPKSKSKKPVINFGLKKDMTWNQAKKAYPKLKPLGDWDKDGVKNFKDCKPFDKSRHKWVKGLGWRATQAEMKQSYRALRKEGVSPDSARMARSWRPSKVAGYIRDQQALQKANPRLKNYAKVGLSQSGWKEEPDFYIQRRGSEKNVGRVRPKGTQEKLDIGVRVDRKVFVPKYAEYALQNVHNQGYYKDKAVGTTNLKSIRVADVKNIPIQQQQVVISADQAGPKRMGTAEDYGVSEEEFEKAKENMEIEEEEDEDE